MEEIYSYFKVSNWGFW